MPENPEQKQDSPDGAPENSGNPPTVEEADENAKTASSPAEATDVARPAADAPPTSDAAKETSDPAEPEPTSEDPPARTPPAPPEESSDAKPADAPERAETEAKPPEPEREKPRPDLLYVGARFGKSFDRGLFTSHLKDLAPGEPVVLKTRRGTEHGTVFCIEPDPDLTQVEGRVLRRPSAGDLERVKHLENAPLDEEAHFCRQKIEEHGLSMNLVDVERILGGEKIIFYFTANGRIDFRGLVKSLAQQYRMRIELKQIGVRDEAKLLGTIAHCGRELCCRGHLRQIEQVTMKMAKVQKSTLDPSKISGRCGRLMCCLRYEDETYREFKAQLPHKGTKVWTEKGQADVLGHQIITRKLFVRGPGGERFLVAMDDLLDGPPPEPEPPPPVRRRPSGSRRRTQEGAPAGRGDGAEKKDGAKDGTGRGRPGGGTSESGESRPGGSRRSRGRGRRRGRSRSGKAPDGAKPKSDEGDQKTKQGPPSGNEKKQGQPSKRRRSGGRRRRRPRGKGGNAQDKAPPSPPKKD